MAGKNAGRRRSHKGGSRSRKNERQQKQPVAAVGEFQDAMERHTLIVTLNSDLCVASGDAFSTGVSTDVCYDKDGRPTIPARRLKGCLREAAELVCDDRREVLELFGESGGRAGSIVVGDATLVVPGDNRDRSTLDGMKRQQVIDRYTYVRAQTALEPGEGHVRDGSLRFVRVVRQYDPLSLEGDDPDPSKAEPLKFKAHIVAQSGQRKLLEKACKALRNIGFGRNRGFGAVTCRLNPGSRPIKRGNDIPGIGGFARNRDCMRIAYRVRLDAPLMLPQSNSEGLDYVPGSSVLGFFASKLAGSACFDDLFLGGGAKFSPLYPTDARQARCMPRPSFVVEVKGGKADGELCTPSRFVEAGYRGDGSLPRVKKEGFVGADWQPVKVATEVVYHHSTGKTMPAATIWKAADEPTGEPAVPADASLEPTLYTQRCLSAGQELAGFIHVGSEDQREAVLDVFRSWGRGHFAFGRSKTAQYARCTVAACMPGEAPRKVSIEKGRAYAFVLDSDAVVCDEDGRPSTSYKALKDAIRKALGEGVREVFLESDAELAKGRDVDSNGLVTNLHFCTLTGYNAKWNQKKPHVRAIAAGSTVAFVAQASASIPSELWIGQRNTEGLGRVLVVSLADDLKDVESPAPRPKPKPKPAAASANAPSNVTRGNSQRNSTLPMPASNSSDSKPTIVDPRKKEELRMKAVRVAKINADLFCTEHLNPSFVGRLTSMVEESKSGGDLDKRIKSIKNDRMQSKKDDSILLVKSLRDSLGAQKWKLEQECLLLVLLLGRYHVKEMKQREKAAPTKEVEPHEEM